MAAFDDVRLRRGKGENVGILGTLGGRRIAPLWVAVAIVAVTLLAVWGVFRLVGDQRDFELLRWGDRLASAAAGADRVAGKFTADGLGVLRSAAANPTVQIYLSELAVTHFDPAAVEQGEAKRSFVGSYVASLGQRGLFRPAGAASTDGNLSAGVALFGADGALIASTQGFAPSRESVAALWSVAASQGRAIGSAVVDGKAVATFVVPIMPLQAITPNAPPVGFLVGSSILGNEFWAAFEATGAADMQTVLLDRHGDEVSRLGPPMDKGKGVGSLAVNARENAGLLQAAAAPDALLLAAGPDGANALLYGKAVAGTPWVIVTHIPESVALSGVNERLQSLLVSLLFGLLALIAAVFALWRHGAATHAAEAASVAEAHSAALARRERMLQTVADTHPGSLVLLDPDNRIIFANARFAGDAGSDPASLVGRALSDTLPAHIARIAAETLGRCQAEGRAVSGGEIEDADGRSLSLTAVPLRGVDEDRKGALLSLDDISEAVKRRQDKVHFYWTLTNLLLEAIDQRDPGAAAHSRRVSALAAELSAALGADREEVETTKLAGALLNVGKLFVPAELLTKTGPLTDGEKRQIASGGERWLGLLSQISTDLPIGSVLSDARRLMNGAGLAEDAPARREARVIVVANGFVAIVSPRTYRARKTPHEAVEELVQSGKNGTDVVAALRGLDLGGWNDQPLDGH